MELKQKMEMERKSKIDEEHLIRPSNHPLGLPAFKHFKIINYENQPFPSKRKPECFEIDSKLYFTDNKKHNNIVEGDFYCYERGT